jgi:hypothetical protein
VDRPEFVISKLETIDDRFPTLDDAGVLLELLYHYRPTLKENDWQVWETVSPTASIEKQFMTEFTVKMGDNVVLPEEPFLWAQFNIEQSKLGKVTEILYKSAAIYLELNSDSGSTARYRIVPSMTGYGFLLNPEIKSDDNLVAMVTGSALHKYTSMKIVVDPDHQKLFRRQVQVKLWALPNPERVAVNRNELQRGEHSVPNGRDNAFLLHAGTRSLVTGRLNGTE